MSNLMVSTITVSNVDFQWLKRLRSTLTKDRKNSRLLLKSKKRKRRLRKNLLPKVRKSLKFAKLTTSISAKKS